MSLASAYANVFVDEVIGRYLPKIELRMEPGAHEKYLILPGNQENSGGLLAIKFQEHKEFYGFSALICNAENAVKYEARESALCFRKEIDLKSDVLRFKYEGAETYYLFIVNRTKPLRTKRHITATLYAYTPMTEEIRQTLIEQVNFVNEKLTIFFGIEPINFAIVPCQKKYIPSSVENRTITACSEMVLGDDMVPDYELMLSGLFYDIGPILERDWGTKQINNTSDRLEFVSTMIMIFSRDKQGFSKFLNLLDRVPDMEGILRKNPNFDQEEDTLLKYVNKLIKISNDPFTQTDQWSSLAYENMTNEVLEKIKQGDIKHFSSLRDLARIVLKRRYEQKLRAENPPTDDEQKNIISDFW